MSVSRVAKFALIAGLMVTVDNAQQRGGTPQTDRVPPVNSGGEFVLQADGQQLSAKPVNTRAWDRFAQLDLGELEMKQTGESVISIRPKSPASWKAMNLRAVRLTPMP